MMKNSVIIFFLLFVSPVIVWGSEKTLPVIDHIVTDKSSYSIIKETPASSGTLEEDGIIREALSNNLALKAQFERFGISRSEIIEESLLKNPKFSYSSRRSNQANSKKDNEWEVKVDAMDLLLWPLKLQAKHRQIKSAEFLLASEVLDFIKEVRINFYRLKEAQAVMDSYQDEMTAQQTILDIAQGMFKAGNSNVLQWQKAQVTFHEARLGFLDAKRDLAVSKENLNLLLGLPPGQDDPQVDGQFKDIPSREPALPNLQLMATANRLEIVIAKAQVGILSNKLTMARAGLLPEVDVGYDQEREAPGDTLKGPVFEADIPIFNFNQAGMLRYESLLSEAKINIPAVEALVSKEVNVAYQQLMTARAKVEDIKQTLPLYDQITRETLYHYNFMLKDVFSVLEAKKEQLIAKQEFAKAISEYWQARAELEHAVGHTLPNQGGS